MEGWTLHALDCCSFNLISFNQNIIYHRIGDVSSKNYSSSLYLKDVFHEYLQLADHTACDHKKHTQVEQKSIKKTLTK